jgi:ferric-dicitrate binding protein FerR (iron transport regulator)
MSTFKNDERALGEEQIASLLRRVGPRPEPEEAALRRAREEVREAWQQSVASARFRRQRWRRFAGAAGVLLVLGMVFLSLQNPEPRQGIVLAHALVQDAGLELRGTVQDGPSEWHSIDGADALRAGDLLRTRPGAYGALVMNSGATLRLDRDSLLELHDGNEVFLHRGAVYVDAPGASSLAIATQRGVARDIGTRYEVRLGDKGWKIQVREGLVAIEDRQAGNVTAEAGERLEIELQGVSRTQVSPTDESWQWTHAALPPLEIEGATLKAYLRWWSDETGYSVGFSRPIDEALAEQTELHGSLGEMSLDEGFAAVVAGAGYRVVDRNEQRVMLGR